MPDPAIGTDHAGAADDRRWEEVVRTHRRMVRGALGRMLPADEVDDAEQAVYLILHRRRASDLEAADIAPWLHRTAVLVARNAARRRATRLRHVGSMHDLPEPAHPQEDASLVAALLPHLDAALDALPADQRQVVIAHHLEGTPLVDIAARMGIPVNTAYTRVHRGIEKLRRILGRRQPGLSTASIVAVLGNAAAAPSALPTLPSALPTLPAAPSAKAASLAASSAGGGALLAAAVAAVLAVLLAVLGGYLAAEPGPVAPAPAGAGSAPDLRPMEAYLGLSIIWERQSRLLPDGRRAIPVETVAQGSPAAAAGLRPGDLLVRLDGQRLSTNSEIKMILRKRSPGDRIPIAFVRDGALQVVEVALAGIPSWSAGHPADARPAAIADGRWLDDDPLRGWYMAGPLEIVERADAEGPVPGVAAMRITTLNAPSASYARAVLVTDGPVGPRLDQLRGRRVRFSAMLRCEGDGARANLWILAARRQTEERPFLQTAFDNMPAGRGLLPRAGWQRMETVIDVDPTADMVVFGVKIAGLGRLWIAEPRLEEVDRSVASTSLVDRVEGQNRWAMARWAEARAGGSATRAASATAAGSAL